MKTAAPPHRVRRRPIVALMSANAVSLAGNQLALLALPWFVLQTTGSPGRVGLAGAIEAIGIVLASFFGGVLVDRFGFRRSSILADCSSGTAVALIPLLDRAVGLAFWQLLFLIFVATIFNTPGSTARNGILPDLAELASMQLERATSVDQAIKNLASLAGPLLAGVLIATISARNVLWIDAASFAFSAVVVALFIPFQARRTGSQQPNYFGALREGLRFIGAERLIRSLGLLGAYVNAVGAALMAVLLPVLAKQVFGSSVDLGILIAADGGGALLGTLLFGARGDRWPRRAALLSAFFCSFVALAALATTPRLSLMVALLVIDGMAFGIIGPLVYTIYQERTPADLRGRVFGTLSAFHRLAAPAGVILAGYSIQLFSLTSALAAVALLSLVMPVVIAATPVFRSMERPANLDAERLTSRAG